MKHTTPLRVWAAVTMQQLGFKTHAVKRVSGLSEKQIRVAVQRSLVTPKLRYQIMKRDGWRCRLCGKFGQDTQLEVDHRIALANGGSSHEDNLWTLCWNCNRGKGVLDA